MDAGELRRLIVRHRHVAPMLSVLLAGTDARVRITDLEGEVILDRQTGAASADAPVERHAIVIEGATVGWVEGPRPAGSIAAVLGYAGARETDKRSLAREALDRYRELNLIYDLADQIGAVLETDAIATVAVAEASRLPSGGTGFVLLLDEDGARLSARPSRADTTYPIAEHETAAGILGAILAGDPEIVNDVAADPRATEVERAFASLVAAPLRVRGERIGVIGTISTEPIEFHASDLRLLGAIASLAAPTFDQAAAHESALRASGATD
ncbi:MAG TPA: GAF domain-containing protein [Candidatus Limnocylindrales bacterium]|nr:GAF domain-containing protein [Candidatus Limnocylindrales bacterium]